jgi:hypothetical protein
VTDLGEIGKILLKTDLKVIGREDADRINLSVVRDQWQTIVSTVNSGNLLICEPSATEE